MSLKIAKNENQIKIITKILIDNRSKLFEKNNISRVYLSDELCCNISIELSNNLTVSPYFDLNTGEIFSGEENSTFSYKSDEICFLAFEEIRSLLKPSYIKRKYQIEK